MVVGRCDRATERVIVHRYDFEVLEEDPRLALQKSSLDVSAELVKHLLCVLSERRRGPGRHYSGTAEADR